MLLLRSKKKHQLPTFFFFIYVWWLGNFLVQSIPGSHSNRPTDRPTSSSTLLEVRLLTLLCPWGKVVLARKAQVPELDNALSQKEPMRRWWGEVGTRVAPAITKSTHSIKMRSNTSLFIHLASYVDHLLGLSLSVSVSVSVSSRVWTGTDRPAWSVPDERRRSF